MSLPKYFDKINPLTEPSPAPVQSTTFALGEKAYLWIRAEGGTGETLTVTWSSGDQSFPVTLNIGGSPWRTWANKTLHLAGEWTVTVTDAAGAKLSETKLSVQ